MVVKISRIHTERRDIIWSKSASPQGWVPFLSPLSGVNPGTTDRFPKSRKGEQRAGAPRPGQHGTSAQLSSSSHALPRLSDDAQNTKHSAWKYRCEETGQKRRMVRKTGQREVSHAISEKIETRDEQLRWAKWEGRARQIGESTGRKEGEEKWGGEEMITERSLSGN